MTDYNKIAMDNLNALMREIAEYFRMAEEIGATLDSLKDSLKKSTWTKTGLTVSPGMNTRQVIKP